MSDINKLTRLGSARTKYAYKDPDSTQLEAFDYPLYSSQDQIVGFKTDEYSSLCPRTGQPDFASIDIVYVPLSKGVESKSLKLYLFRYRNHGAFHEDCVAKICNDIAIAISPKYLRVIGDFTRRGGIAIKPISTYINDKYIGDIYDFRALVQQYDRFRFGR